MARLFTDVRRASPAVKRFLLGALLLGAGQQMFVVVRNQYLADLGWATQSIPAVQGAGALAGIASALFAVVFAGRLSARALFVGCAVIQTSGFALQASTTDTVGIFVGAGVAGLAIQLNTTLTAPLLVATTSGAERASVFAASNLALAPLGGVIAALVIRIVTHGPARQSQRRRIEAAAESRGRST